MRLWPALLIVSGLGTAACSTPEPASRAEVDAIVQDARLLDLEGRQDEAIAMYESVLEQQADHFGAHYGLGRALDLVGRYEDARGHFARAIELSPDGDRDQALRMMGIAWTFAGDVEQAAGYFRQVVDRRLSQGNAAGAADVANELGRVYLEAGLLDEAETWYRTGHETAQQTVDRPAWMIDMHDMRWAHAEARIAARRGQGDEARRLVASVRTLLDKGGNEDQEIQFPYLVGYVEFHLGNHSAAIDALQDADKDDPFILYLLARAHEALGDRDEARAFYEGVLLSNSHAVNSAFSRPVARDWLAQQ